MQDLSYFLALGFSGSDATRGLVIGLLASLFVSSRFLPWRAVLLACIVDRVWPYYGMYLAETEGPVILQSMWAEITTMPFNLLYYAIRFTVIFGIVHVGFHLRRLIHAALGQPVSSRYPGKKHA